MSLLVAEIFDSIQGEGYWTGIPMTFVRLAGCNGADLGLECVNWCDTPGSRDTATGQAMEVGEVVEHVHLPRLCLTGGEPLLQLDGVAELLLSAEQRLLRVHVETNGTLDPRSALRGNEAGLAWCVVSPKPPAFLVDPGWEGLVDELKLVADERLDAATAERLAAAHPGAVVCIQPEWGGGGLFPGAPTDHGGAPASAARTSVDRAIALVMAHPDWRLSLQTHKILGVR